MYGQYISQDKWSLFTKWLNYLNLTISTYIDYQLDNFSDPRKSLLRSDTKNYLSIHCVQHLLLIVFIIGLRCCASNTWDDRLTIRGGALDLLCISLCISPLSNIGFTLPNANWMQVRMIERFWCGCWNWVARRWAWMMQPCSRSWLKILFKAVIS